MCTSREGNICMKVRAICNIEILSKLTQLWLRHLQAVSLLLSRLMIQSYVPLWVTKKQGSYSVCMLEFSTCTDRVLDSCSCPGSLAACLVRCSSARCFQICAQTQVSEKLQPPCSLKWIIICWQDLFSSRIVNLASSGAASLITKIVCTLFMSRCGRPHEEAVATNTWAQI